MPMEPDVISHPGRVCAVVNDRILVKLLPGRDAGQCSGCALAFSCSGASGDEAVVEVLKPTGLTFSELAGQKVLLQASSGSKMKAVMLLLVLPLVVVLIVAISFSFTSLDQGLGGLCALIAAAATYLVLWGVQRKRPPVWTIVKILKEPNQ